MLEATQGQLETAWPQEVKFIMVGNSPLMTETTTGPMVTVLCHFEVPGGTIAVMSQTSMASTSVELAITKVSGGAPSTQLLILIH